MEKNKVKKGFYTIQCQKLIGGWEEGELERETERERERERERESESPWR